MAIITTMFLLGLPAAVVGAIESTGDAPTITSDGGSATADVNVATGDTAVTTVTATGTGTETFSIVGGAEALMFTINSSSGALAFTTTSVDGEYEVIVAATNDWGQDRQAITVTVAAFHVDAVHFDGSTWLEIASLLATDNEFFSMFWWFRPTSFVPIPTFFVSDPGGNYTPFGAFAKIDGKYSAAIACGDGSGNIGRTGQIDAKMELDTWYPMLFSADSQNGTARLYQADVSVGVLDSSGVPFTLAPNGKQFVFGGDDSVGAAIIGDVAEVWIDPGVSLLTAGDIPEATRRKFISASGKPVNLGADGSTPTGTAPRIYFSGDAAAFATNRGTGGAFTLTGSLTDASTSPSD